MSGWTIGAIAVSTMVSAYGSYQQSRAQQQQADFQAAVARNNAIIARQNAQDIRETGKVEKMEHRERVAQSKGAVTPDAAARGLLADDTPDSTVIQMKADIEQAGALDMARIDDKTERLARQALIQGTNFDAQAGLFSLKSSSQNPGLAAAGTLLAGAAQAAMVAKKA